MTQYQWKNVKNGHMSNEGFTMISSCNTCFAKVKFRLQKTKLEKFFDSCPERKLFRGNCLRSNCPGGEFMEDNCPGGSYPGGIIQGKLFGGQKPGGQLSWGKF